SVDESGEIAGLGIADLIAATYVGLALSKPGKLPGEADGRSDLIPIVLVQAAARIGAVWPNQLDAHQKIRVYGVVRPQPFIEASARNAEHRNAAPNGRWSQSAVLVRCSVKLVTHSKIQGEGWMHLPIVFEEHGPIVLVRPGELPRMIHEAVPLRVLRVVDVIIHLCAIE